MAYVYHQRYGGAWLDRISSQEQRDTWADRAQAERAVRIPKGVAATPGPGLQYSNFFDLLNFAEKDWEPLADALGKKASTMPLLKRFDNLRNTVAHSRPLLPFEADLLSGIAGQIRNQVTLYMSQQDRAGDHYPRIEAISDSLGQRFDGPIDPGYRDYGVVHPNNGPYILHPGEAVQFTCTGTDPQGRELEFELSSRLVGGTKMTARSASGEPVTLTWVVKESDVALVVRTHITLKAVGTNYHRIGKVDQRVTFPYRVDPPDLS